MKLDKRDHRSLVLWAIDCAEHVLPYFEKKYPKDKRPQRAIEATRAWVRGEVALSVVRTAALAAHAAARAATESTSACAAARAVGHAAGTAHAPSHAAHAAAYAAKAKAAVATAKEQAWQVRRLPNHLRSVVFPD